MNDRIKWIEHKGKQILLCDFSKYDENQYIAGIDDMEKELLDKHRESKILSIIDIANSSMSKATSDRAKVMVENLVNEKIIAITAIVGITGIQKIIAKAIQRNIYFANDIESAKDWVVEQ